MGTSNWQNISYCCDVIYRLSPYRTLDIGIGSLGRWATLVREFTDVWSGNVLPGKWERVIDGIEAFPDQIGDLHRCLYDKIFVGDAFEVIDALGTYELIVMGDVLEHFSGDQALPMLEKCLIHSTAVLVTTPLGTLDEWPQEDAYGNPWEVHRVLFKSEDFLRSTKWRVLEFELFNDYRGREFGTFLLTQRKGVEASICAA